jgi:hypothetical protein
MSYTMNRTLKIFCILAVAVTGTLAHAEKKLPLPPQPQPAFVCRTTGTVEFFAAHTFAPRALAKGTRIVYNINVVPNAAGSPLVGEVVLRNTVMKGIKINLAQGEGQGKGCTARISR